MTVTDIPFTPAEEALLAQAGQLPPPRASDILIQLAKSYWRNGESDKFAEAFRRAYAEQPFSHMSELSPHHPNTTPAEMREIALALLRHGVAYAPVLGALAQAEAKLGHADAVRRLMDYPRFFRGGTLAPPDGAGLDDFNEAVAGEIKANLKFYDRPANRAIRRGFRNNEVMQATTPALSALRAMLQAEIDRYVAALPQDAAHPFLAARPAQRRLDGWAVVSTADSRHIAHIHSAAWITGVYYVSQPPISRGSQKGWLRVGPPRGFTATQGWETRMVEPARGSFVLMPGYFYHDTDPMGVAQERICVAFEMQHGELKYLADRDAY